MDKNPHCNCQCHNQGNGGHHHHHHHHNFSKKHIHFRKTLLSQTYFILFIISVVIIISIIIANIILIYKKILIPRIFFPGIIIYIVSFICAGGSAGSYGPAHNTEPELILMRKCTSIVMLIICIVIFPIFLSQNFNIYSSIKSSKTFCEENKGKSKGDIYSELFDEKEKIISLRNNFNHKYKNGLTCFESQKCIKSISSSKIFVCNYNHEEKYNTSKCNKVFETDHIVNTFDNANMAHFVTSCMDLKKEKIRPELDIYKCISSNNICNNNIVTDEEENEIKKYHKKNDKIYEEKILDLQKKIDNFEEDLYSYEEECHSNIVFGIYLFLIILLILATLVLVIGWVVIGISNILKHFGFMEDSELKYYQEKMKRMNNIYNEVHAQKENTNIQNNQNTINYQDNIDETTPINVK